MLPYIFTRIIRKLSLAAGIAKPYPGVDVFETKDLALAERRLADGGDLTRMFLEHSGRPLHKWLQYIPVYEKWLAPYRGTPVRILEIGVSDGGSLQLWRRYFGDAATIYGIDINPACAERFEAPNQVRIGSQADADFLKSVAGEMGTIDIIIDDGSHVASHQRISFETLFPLLKDGGLYVVEDTHSSYWEGVYEGGLRRPGTAVEYFKAMIDDQHAWYHTGARRSSANETISAIHFYDSIILLEKQMKGPPLNIGLPIRP